MLDKPLWDAVAERGAQAVALEKMRVATELRVDRWEKNGLPPFLAAPLAEAAAELRRREVALRREITRLVRGTAEAAWADGVPGMGSALWILIAALPRQPGEYRSVSAFWKDLGLHVHEGRAVRRAAGAAGEHQRFRSLLRAMILYRVAKPHASMTGGSVTYATGPRAGRTVRRALSPYRPVLDARLARTLVTHPPMLTPERELAHPDCRTCRAALAETERERAGRHLLRERKGPAKDCAALGGPHWTEAHRQADALRVMAKAIARDLWRVWRGLPALYAGGGESAEAG